MTSRVRLVIGVIGVSLIAWFVSLRLPEQAVVPGSSRPDGLSDISPCSGDVAHGLVYMTGSASMSEASASLPILARSSAEQPQWAIRFGAEFWRSHLSLNTRPLRTAGLGSLRPAALKDAIERVRNTFETTEKGELQARSSAYRATLDGSGVRLETPERGAQTRSVTVRTRSIRRGTQSYLAAQDPSGWCVLGNTAQRQIDAASGIVEHYEIRSDGVEVAWVVARLPGGTGDLLIEAEVPGARLSTSWDAGESGEAADALTRCVIGRASAVDQNGREWPLNIEVAGGSFTARVPEAVLAQASFPLAIDPLLTPEFALDAITDGASPGTRTAPAIAANEAGYLLAWCQGKTEMADAGVFAARISPDGTLLDPYGFLVSAQAAEQSVCAVASNEGLFMVAWAAPHGTSTTDWDVLGVRVSTNGVVLDTSPLALATTANVQCSPASAANGLGFLVVWRDTAMTGISGRIVAADGTLSPVSVLLNATGEQFSPAVASLGTNYLVVAQDYRKATFNLYHSDIYGARVDGSGKLLDATGFAICTNSGSQFHPAVASDGTNYFVVWQDYDIGGSDIRGARVAPDATVLDTNALVICHAPNSQVNPTVAAAGGGYVVLWQDYRDSGSANYESRTYGARVAGDGTVLDPDGIALSTGSGGQYYPALATRTGKCLAVWQDFRNNPGTVLSDIFGRQLAATNLNAAGVESLLSGAANAEISPALAALGSNYLAVWADDRHGFETGWDICGVRLDTNGAPIDPLPIWISTATNRQSQPAIAAGSAGYFVAWSDWRNTSATMQHGDIYGTVVSPEGLVRQPVGIPICTVTNDQSLPAVTAFGTNFLAIWQDARLAVPGIARLDIYGARIGADGTVLDPGGFPVCTNVAIQTNPVVAATATCALTAWADYRLNSALPDIFAARVGMDGSVLDTNGVPVCTANGVQNLPAIAADGSGFLLVWADSRNGSAYAPDIFGALVDGTGSVSPTNGFPIRTGLGPQTAPVVAFSGRDYLVSWQEATNNAAAFDIYATQVSLDEKLALGPVFKVDTNANSQVYPSVAASADERFLVLNESSATLVRRAVGNIVDSEAVPRITGGPLGRDNRFELRFHGAIGKTYRIEASDDLQSWTPLREFTNATPSSVFVESVTNSPLRYFRAVLLQ